MGNRTISFSANIINFCKNEKMTPITKPLIEHLVRSATSIGANYAEANNAASKADFRSKIYIAKKEAAETKYWLALMLNLAADRKTCTELLNESHYLLMTFQKIISTLKNGKQKAVNAR